MRERKGAERKMERRRSEMLLESRCCHSYDPWLCVGRDDISLTDFLLIRATISSHMFLWDKKQNLFFIKI